MDNTRGFRRWILALDLGWLLASMLCACLLRYAGELAQLPRPTLLTFSVTLLEAALLWTVLWSPLGLDGFRGGWRFPAVLSQLLLGVSIVMVTVLASGYLTRAYISRLVVAYFAILTLGGFVFIRVAAHSMLNERHRSGAARRVIIVGGGPLAREVAAKIERHPEILFQVIGFLFAEDSALELRGQGVAGSMISVRTSGVIDLFVQKKIDEVIFAASTNSSSGIVELMEQCVKVGIAVSVVPQPYELYLSNPELMDLAGLPIVRLRHSACNLSDPAWKRILDVGLASVLLLPSVPLILSGSALLRLRKGKGFCREERCGRGGKPFWMYRLNSPRQELKLPTYERVMQHLSITELPQLLNVLRGDMSLVGPRPEPLISVRHYTDWHLRRLNVKPGITGLAQVHGLRDQHSLEDKTRYDLQYILRRSLFQDLSILLQTIWTLTRRIGPLPKSNGSGAVQQPASTSSIAAQL